MVMRRLRLSEILKDMAILTPRSQGWLPPVMLFMKLTARRSAIILHLYY